MIYRQGSWHGSAIALDWEGVEQIAGSEQVEASVYSQQLGYAVLENPKNEYKPYLYLIGAGEGFDGMMSVHLTAGRYPASPQELFGCRPAGRPESCLWYQLESKNLVRDIPVEF